MALEFKDATFDEEVLKSSKLSVVDFWATWCGPCLALAPTIEDLAKEYKDKVNVGKLNVDENSETAAKYGIRSIPTVLFFKNGEVIKKFLGVQPKKNFVKVIEANS